MSPTVRRLTDLTSVLLVLAASLVAVTARARADAVPTVTGDHRVDQLLARMTLDEKLTMLEGQVEADSASKQYQAGYLPGIAHLGIPSLRLTDGPPGVITKQDSTGMTATMGLAATFSHDDARANGEVIGRDAKALGQNVVLEPFVNLDRDTSWGRGFNTFGEDPLLTGQTGADEIRGIQSQGTMAQVKHYLGYDGASRVDVDEQTLHEIYLQPFADAVGAGVSSVMCSYNQINGQQACDSTQTLTDILEKELGFSGFITSDWGGNHATSSLNAGLDVEMPGGDGPSAYFTKDALRAAIKNGAIKIARVTDAVGRILYEYDRFGLLGTASTPSISAEDRSGDDRVVQHTAEDAATLLKNAGDTLPLNGRSSIALIGPTAGQTDATDGGGEKAGGIVAEQTGPYRVMKQELGPDAQLSYSVADDMTGTAVPASALSHHGRPGLVRTDRDTHASTVDPTVNFTDANRRPLSAGSNDTWSGSLTVPATGDYWLNIQALGGTANLTVDGRSLTTVGASTGDSPRYGIVHATDGNGPLPTTDGMANGRTQLRLGAGRHALSITETADASGDPVQVRLDWVTPTQQKTNHDAAIAAAKNAQTAVVFAWAAGSTDLSTPLADEQDRLIEDVAAVNPNTVVVLNTSQPIAMPWLSSVKSVLEMWYPGDRGGYATARVLLGAVDPGGKLPFTWPATLDQEVAHQPAHPERSSSGVASDGKSCPPNDVQGPDTITDCTTTYSEGIDVGYRFYDADRETPLFPFGYGLSYTSFSYANLRATTADDGGLTVTFTVRNNGARAGDTVPQAYLGAPTTRPKGVQFAQRALGGYLRVRIAAGQTQTVQIHVPSRQLQYWSTTSGWTTAVGRRTVELDTSERGIALRTTIDVR